MEWNATTVLIMRSILSAALVFLVLLIPTQGPALMMGMPARSLTLGDLSFSVYPRIFTPNGDGANDKAAFHFSNPEDLPVAGEIFDLGGAKVADLKPGADPAALLLWDGKTNDGRTVPAGIYLYQIEYQGKRATGTVILAR